MEYSSYYYPLSAAYEQIRILVISPLSDTELENEQFATGVPIQCHLEHVSLLKETGNYVALSYRWGNTNDVTSIWVSGIQVSVTRTLSYALKELRRCGIYRVWADAVCINQYDLEERAQQVMRMGSIYLCARRTMAWLGHYPKPSDLAQSDRACRLIEALAPMTPEDKRRSTSVSEDWGALQEIFKRSYWSRAWIIQEVAMAGDVEFFWTQHSFQFWRLESAMERCERLKTDIPPAMDLISMPEFQHISSLFRFRRSRASPIRLIHALILSRRAESSDPRDKLYALISLASDGSNTIPFPNYSVTLADLNRNTAIRMITSNATLDGVILPGHVPKTWVPQWHAADTWRDERVNSYLAREAAFVAERSHQSRSSSRVIRNGWKATLDKAPQWKLISQGLEVSVKSIGRISRCSATLQEALDDELRQTSDVNSNWTADTKTVISLCWLLYDLLPNNAYIRARKVDARDIHHLLDRESSKKSIKTQVPGVYKWLFCKKNLLFKIGDKRLSDWFCGSDGHWSLNHPATDLAKRSLSILEMGMRLITTDKGLVGWATKSCEPGDELFLLRGCSVPVVLRKEEDGRYNIIGDSIVHGLMSGQGVTDQSYPQWTKLQLI